MHPEAQQTDRQTDCIDTQKHTYSPTKAEHRYNSPTHSQHLMRSRGEHGPRGREVLLSYSHFNKADKMEPTEKEAGAAASRPPAGCHYLTLLALMTFSPLPPPLLLLSIAAQRPQL